MVANSRPGLATGGGSLDGLRSMSKSDPKAAVKEVSKQFEALFMQELMKSMRASTMSSGMLDNSGTELATGMLDSQYAMQMSGLPGSLADAIARQLSRQMGTDVTGTPGAPGVNGHDWRSISPRERDGGLSGLSGSGASGADPLQGLGSNAERAQAFVRSHVSAAQAAESMSGIPASFMVAQAAHETGWGRKELRGADGTNSFNLFGIKATGDWKGATVTTTTTEVYDGRPVKVEAKFRAYGSYEESFRDYAKLISQNPRYAGVMNELQNGRKDGTSFAQGLQKAGYATDPLYASKLSRVIDTTLRLQRLTV